MPVAHFVVTGEFVTKHARDRILEYGWPDAARFLTDSVVGLGYDRALDILGGKMRLMGSSRDAKGLRFAAEKSTRRAKLIEQQRWRYSGVWYDRTTKRNWIPYAYVTSWGPGDMREGPVPNRYTPKPAKPFLSRYCGGDPEGWGAFRCIAYMDDPIEDQVLSLELPTGEGPRPHQILWKQFPEDRPPWMKKVTDPQKALVEWVASHGLDRLDERGSHTWRPATGELSLIGYGADDDDLPQPPPQQPPAKLDGISQNVLDLIPAGLADHVREGIARRLAGVETVAEIADNPAEHGFGWVQGDGTFWRCGGYMDHQPMAAAIVEKLGLDISRYDENPDHALTEMNWVKCGTDAAGSLWAFTGQRTTQRQKDVVTKWMVDRGADAETVSMWLKRVDQLDY